MQDCSRCHTCFCIAQWLAGRPGHPFREGPRGYHSFQTQLGLHFYEDGPGLYSIAEKKWKIVGDLPRLV